MYASLVLTVALAAHVRAAPAEFDHPTVQQRPIGLSPNDLSEVKGIPILTNQSIFSLLYNAKISVGTPPQSFYLAVDLSLAEVAIPSQDCKGVFYCDQVTNQYAHNVSSSYTPIGGYHSFRWPGVTVNGYLSSDTLHLTSGEGQFQIEDFVFEEWNDLNCWAIGCQAGGYDGVFGLAGPWEAGVSSVLSAIHRQKLLHRRLFSLRLPSAKGGHDGEGELLFGVHRARESDITWLPVAENASLYGWAVKAESVTFHTPKKMSIDLPKDHLAVFATEGSQILLPDELARNISKTLGAVEMAPAILQVECSQRSYMPDLSFSFSGHELTISAWDYVLEFETWNPGQIGKICMLAVHPIGWYGVPYKNIIILGSAFVRGFEWIGDWEEGRIGFARQQ